jgi:archaellum component FlaG (FlaF/FlaG flagellin family)
MNKKLLLGVLCIAVVALGAASVVADTWMSRIVNFSFTTGTSQNIELFRDCSATLAPETWNQMVTQGNTYEYTLYVENDGTELLYITYLPTNVVFDAGQTRFYVTVAVINFGVACQMTDNNIPLPTGITSLPFALPEKNVNAPNAGFPLAPNKMIKLDVMVRCDSVDLNHVGGWQIPFEVVGVSI